MGGEGDDEARLEALLSALEAIVDRGRFEERLPTTTRGDAWDGVHAAINVLLDILGAKLGATETSARRAALAEERAQALSDAAHEGLVVARDGRIVDVNRAFAEMLGYPPAELVGRDIDSFFAPPERAAIAARLAQGATSPFRTRLARRDGTEIVVESRARRASYLGATAHIASVRDVTEETRMVAALEDTSRELAMRTRRLEALLDSLPVGVLIETVDHRIERIGVGLLDLLGLPAAAAETLLTPAAYLDRVADVFADAAALRHAHEHWPTVAVRAASAFHTKSGRIVRVVYGPIGRGASAGHLWLYEDVTVERREAERQRAFVERVVVAQDEERRRIAQELHDGAAQSATALLVGLRALAEITTEPAVAARAAALRRLAEDVLADTSRIARGLHPATLSDLGLATALERLGGDMVLHHGIATDVEIRGSLDRIPARTESTIYRVVQEALSNAARHGGARSASVVVVRDGRRLRVLVEDDGAGFDVESQVSSGLGLRGMRERAAAVGGTLELDSTPGEGTVVALDVPLGEGERA